MFDTNLLFHNAAALTTTGTSASMDLGKTPADGVDMEIAVTAVAGSTTGLTMDFVVRESDNDSTYNDLVTFPQMSAVGLFNRRIKTKKRYLALKRTAGAATGLSFTVTAGIVSGIHP